MPAPDMARARAVSSEAGDGGPSAELDAALRALHIATIHLNDAWGGTSEPLLIARSRFLVRQATALLAAANRLRDSA